MYCNLLGGFNCFTFVSDFRRSRCIRDWLEPDLGIRNRNGQRCQRLFRLPGQLAEQIHGTLLQGLDAYECKNKLHKFSLYYVLTYEWTL